MAMTFVTAIAKHDLNGYIQPISLIWTDDREFEIDRVSDIRMAPSLKSGGHGIRYTCRIRSKEVYLFCDEEKWFIER